MVAAIVTLAGMACPADPGVGGQDSAVQRLAREVAGKGWIAYAARSEAGDWDIFVIRPDGLQCRNITGTADFNEFHPQFSRDGAQLLYRRIARSEAIDGNDYGAQGELVIAHSDGAGPRVCGAAGEYPWASWSPDARQIACLSVKGVCIVEISGGRVVRMFDRKGFFQQMTWSPDGRWLIGVANSYGTGWSIARMDAATGAATPVNVVDCCTPDWFPDSRQVIFSWRPPGQKANKGYGWTQLWMADGDGASRQLVYGEDGRHVYGGHVSPDGRYVIFTGNVNEDGDPGHSGAPMGLMRLADAPVIGGESPDLRSLHPQARRRPVLALPVGWEPCWTFAEIARPAAAEEVQPPGTDPDDSQKTRAADSDVRGLAHELRDKGRLIFSARTERGDWDLFVMRPDGTDRRRITDTREHNEAGPRFSRDGRRLLYYRMPTSEPVDNNTYGTFMLVIADADGNNGVEYGDGFGWASWGADSGQLACLTPKGIQVIDTLTRRVVRQIPRKGMVQQLAWSPDGKWFVGTANGLGQFWNIGRMSGETGELNAVADPQRYNCTPDWLPDSNHVLFSRGIIPNQGGRAELWMAQGDGTNAHMIYAEGARHIYGACASPDGKYVVFTRSVEDLGKVDNSQTTMAIVRLADTPMVADRNESLGKAGSDSSAGPRLDLGLGWEPDWTYYEFARQ